MSRIGGTKDGSSIQPGSRFMPNTHPSVHESASSLQMRPHECANTAALAQTARAEMALLAYPDRSWVESPPLPKASGATPALLNVLIVGGGQSALAISARLHRDGVNNVLMLDAAEEGAEGVWDNFARMPELRTPKVLNGMDLGLASLSVQRWYQARHGVDAWERIDRIPRTAWADYLRWYRHTLALPMHNRVQVHDVRPAGAWIAVDTQTPTGPRTYLARSVVLATGFDGAGAWRVPAVVSDALPSTRYNHSADRIDFARLQGRRIGILGHGASAFDNAVAALRAGAASVDLCFRRDRLPRANPHRHIETAGFMQHFHALPDATRWQVAQYFRAADQPPPRGSFDAALKLPGFRMRSACPWTTVRMTQEQEIEVDTPHGTLQFDHLICATGQTLDLAARPELQTLAPLVSRWCDRHAPAAAANAGEAPYLGAHFEFQALAPSTDSWVSRVFAFNSASHISHGPHCTSISGHKHTLPRVVRGVTQQLFLDQTAQLMPGLRAYDEPELVLPNGIENDCWLPSPDASVSQSLNPLKSLASP
ncbi:cation diffusion facilitator CzcD-associated flavoprotein CzcO [Variovorax boronicumulans]|uniref:SidA/IucD/PvdA family monooxygenase n=1 Tax=Variovorax boronicumulans TaxID=436515 RepID=UPI0027839FEF|nr:SidA/IucD/PvdA family monooxygenase [Variovorax boronicumulans]MDQ0073118.1 cation diffusion facilitator CzcD-associated flavoprotein CzcO [Variovorax boronicumulans]